MPTAKPVELVIHVPAWSEWIAQDRDGTWRVFAGKPTQSAKWWDPDGYQSEIVVLGFSRNPAWRTTLKKI